MGTVILRGLIYCAPLCDPYNAASNAAWRALRAAGWDRVGCDDFAADVDPDAFVRIDRAWPTRIRGAA